MKKVLLMALALSLSPAIDARAEEIPAQIETYCDLVGARYDICPELLEAIAYYESRFEPDVKNGSCYGLMQVNVDVHKDRIRKLGYTSEDMLDAYKNIEVAADLLNELYETYEENAIVLAMYAGDLKGVKEYENSGRVSKFAKRLLDKSYEYEDMHGKHGKVVEW